jgi:hypothetical protein
MTHEQRLAQLLLQTLDLLAKGRLGNGALLRRCGESAVIHHGAKITKLT